MYSTLVKEPEGLTGAPVLLLVAPLVSKALPIQDVALEDDQVSETSSPQKSIDGEASKESIVGPAGATVASPEKLPKMPEPVVLVLKSVEFWATHIPVPVPSGGQ